MVRRLLRVGSRAPVAGAEGADIERVITWSTEAEVAGAVSSGGGTGGADVGRAVEPPGTGDEGGEAEAPADLRSFFRLA